MSNEETELTPEQKAEIAAFDASAKRWAKIQAEELAKRENDEKWKSLGAMPDEEYRAFLRKNGIG